MVGGISAASPKKRETPNQVTAKYIEPAKGWRESSVTWPPPGGSKDRALLALDGGERLGKTVTLRTVASKSQAADLARIIVYRTRGAIRAQFRCLPAAMAVTPGDIIRLTDATLGWSNKKQLVLGLAHLSSGEIEINTVDHDPDVYDWANLDPELLHADTHHPNPLIVPALTGLAAVVVLDRRTKGPGATAVLQTLIGMTVSWTDPADAAVIKTEIAYRVAGDTSAGEWMLAEVPAGSTSVDLLPLRHNDTYELRGRHVNVYGATSRWSTPVTQKIDKDITPPAKPTNLTLTAGWRLIEASWTNPATVGFSHVKGELRRYNDDDSVAETLAGKHFGNSVALAGLQDNTKYGLRLAAVDDAGNESDWTAWVTATTFKHAVTASVGAPVFWSSADDGTTWTPPDSTQDVHVAFTEFGQALAAGDVRFTRAPDGAVTASAANVTGNTDDFETAVQVNTADHVAVEARHKPSGVTVRAECFVNKSAAGRGIKNIVRDPETGVVTITYTDGATATFNLADGVGIKSIVRNATTGVMTITYDDDSTDQVTVPDGTAATITRTETTSDGRIRLTFNDGAVVTIPKGDDGTGIKSIVRSETTGVVTITYDDNTTATFNLADGVGIKSAARNANTGVVTITYDDDSTDTFTVPDGTAAAITDSTARASRASPATHRHHHRRGRDGHLRRQHHRDLQPGRRRGHQERRPQRQHRRRDHHL